MWEVTWLPTVIALSGATIGAFTDIRKFRVYNALTVPLLVSGLLYHSLFSGGIGFSDSALGILFGFGVLIIPFLMRLMGAGDVKLLAGVGAWLGLKATVAVFLASCIVAGVYAFVLILVRGRLGESWRTLKLILVRFASLGIHAGDEDLVEMVSAREDRKLRVIPFGAMVPLGIVGALLWAF
jgi:prepilin peptidase CpaA